MKGAQLSPAKDRIFYLSRFENSLRTIPLSNKLFSCGGEGLGQNCFSNPPELSLSQTDPFFLELFSSQNIVTGGVIGYKFADPFRLIADQGGNFRQVRRFELQRFTWNAANQSAVLSGNIALGDSLRAAQNKGTALPNERATVRITAMQQIDNQIFLLVDNPISSTFPTRRVLLVRVLVSDLLNSGETNLPVAIYDLTANANIINSGLLLIKVGNPATRYELFVSNSLPGHITKLSLPVQDSVDQNGILKVSRLANEMTCDFAPDMKLSPNQTTLVTLCQSGKILLYDAEQLTPIFLDPSVGQSFGRVPLDILFEQTPVSPNVFRFYVANSFDGSITIFDLIDTPTAQPPIVSHVGRIFQPSPLNRDGGTER
jgi:hypothetical protein